ncbi:MAG TPA: hypothetical protein ENG40_04180 [Thermoprotei archaeon]|nr:MAG: hypothetical protein DRJ45_01390 [Thermoprotei archaeon]HDJ89871.1 hypothetical protein [Thermoprotei archaeon]
MKYSILINSYTGHTAADFSLNNIAATSGRLDLVIRCIIATFYGNSHLRKNVDFYAVLNGPPNPPKVIRINGRKIKVLPNTEKEMARILYDILKGKEVSGFTLLNLSFSEILKNLYLEKYKFIYIIERGNDISKVNFSEKEKYLFILGDQKGLNKNDENILKKYNAKEVNLGPISYLTSHCIVILNNELCKKMIVNNDIYAGGGI